MKTGMPRRPHRPGRALRWGLVAAFWLGWAMTLLDNVVQIVQVGAATGLEVPRRIVVSVLLVLVVGVWEWVRRSRSSSPALVALVLVVSALFTLSNTGIATVGLLAVALVLVTLRGGPRVGFGLVVALSLWVVFMMRAVYRAGWIETVGETLAVAVSSSMFIVFAALLRQVELSERRAQEANEQLARTNAELTEANEGLRSAAVVERDLVLAEERARTSRELHDGLGHRLTLVGMSLDYARRVRERDPGAAWAEVEQAAVANRETLDHMRRWVRALHPPQHLPSLGGPAAFDAIADSFRGTGLEVEVTYEGMPEPPPLPQEVSLLAHRVVQEGLTNVLRHADASQVTIAVRQAPDLVEVVVRDDGSGAGEQGEGFGRRNLRERAEALGGTVVGGPSAQGGFELVARIPLAEEGTGENRPAGLVRAVGHREVATG